MAYDANGNWITGGLLTGEGAVQGGLTGAANLISQSQVLPYPSYVPSQTVAPSQQNYMNYTPNQPMAQIQTPNYKLNTETPNYQGLMGGDYNALQQALTTPGALAAQTAYNQGQVNLTNQMGGSGLYGSSIMANQARNALETPYQNALATNAANAAAQRYGMQASDLQNQNQFGLNVYGQQMNQNQAMNAYNQQMAQLGMTQHQNVYQAGVTDAARQQEYNLAAQTYANQGTEAQRQWQNQQLLEQMQYQLASGQYTQEQQTNMINQYLALAGRGQVTSGQNQAASTAQQQMDAATQQALYGNAAGLLTTGGLLYGGSQDWY